MPVIFAIDRAGIVGDDGETHQGIFDLSYLSLIPNMTVLAPKQVEELPVMMKWALKENRPIAIRYPRDGDIYHKLNPLSEIKYGKWEKIIDGDKVAIITTAIMFGLFHANFSQFFYAVGLGVIFAYVTLKTGTIKYSIILHIAINIVGSVIMPSIVGDGSNIALIGVAGLVLIAITIIGIVLLINNRKNIHLSEGEIKLEKGTVAKTIYLNVGMILYIVLCVISMISVVLM